MDKETKDKAVHLTTQTRVMTLAVSRSGVPWSSPVYFVYHDHGFYFFSNEQSRHVEYAGDPGKTAASIFHDSDRIERIFGFQMAGTLKAVTRMALYLAVVKKYVAKFNFLEAAFGSQVIENTSFFLEKFKSRLYVFSPDTVFLSDNARASGKRSPIDLNEMT